MSRSWMERSRNMPPEEAMNSSEAGSGSWLRSDSR